MRLPGRLPCAQRADAICLSMDMRRSVQAASVEVSS
nr:MAG TPA: hypothetical protein [Caudoviricetes sp.]